MITKKVIQKKVYLKYEYLDKNYKNNILTNLIEITKNLCNKEHGYILKINKIIKIKENNITSNGELEFLLDFEADTLYPEKDKIFEGNVCMIFSAGIFVNIKDIFKILIPLNELKNYVYDNTENKFVKDNKIIKVGDIIKVIIIDTKYSKKSFSCFGKIKD